jgi:hypothetical protein
MLKIKTPAEVKKQDERSILMLGCLFFCLTLLTGLYTVFNGATPTYTGVIFDICFSIVLLLLISLTVYPQVDILELKTMLYWAAEDTDCKQYLCSIIGTKRKRDYAYLQNLYNNKLREKFITEVNTAVTNLCQQK